MRHIVAEGLVKTYRVSERPSGRWGAVRGLFTRRVRELKALDQVSFAIQPGELVGYVGPNGAGKSTTLKILSGILVPDAGHCEVLGRVPWRERQKHVAQIGVVFGQRTQLWWDLPVHDSFELIRAIYRVPDREYRQRLDELVSLLDLSRLLHTPVRQLSLGERMRCDLVASLLHAPPLLFLDEPTIGLDAVSKLALRAFIQRMNRERGVTVILTTHDMDDIEALCRRVLVLGHGKLLCDGTLEQLRERVSSERRVTFDRQDSAPIKIAGARLLATSGERVQLAFDPSQLSAAELVGRISAAHKVRDLFIENPPIEHIIAELYRSAAAEHA
jgi:ABC-2 type transport system ATP-binding protein